MASSITVPTQGTGDTTPKVATEVIGGVHFQRVKLVTGHDGTDGGDVEQTAAISNSLPVAMVQNVIASTGNSYAAVAPLAAGNTWSGSIESTLNVAGIQVNLKCDQDCTVYIDQFHDDAGSYGQITDTFNYYSAKGGNSWTIQATASYFRLRVKNVGSASASALHIQTALCPTVECLPRALDSEGLLKTCVERMDSKFGGAAIISPMGALKVSRSTRLAGAIFYGTTLDTNFWAQTPTSGGSVTQAAGQATLNTNTTANGAVLLQSVRTARYIAAHTNYYRGVVRCPANNTTTGTWKGRWGAYDVNNGFFFELNQGNGTATTVLRLVCRTNQSGSPSDAVYVDSGSFNGDTGSAHVVDTNPHTYEIYWTNKSAWFFIDDVLIHKFASTTDPLSAQTHLKVGAESINAGSNAANNTIILRAASISRLGDLSMQPTSKYSAGTTAGTILKYGPGNLHGMTVSCTTATNTTVTLYDGTTTGGTILFSGEHASSNNSRVPTSYQFYGLPFADGLFLVVSSAANVTVIYE